MAVGGDLEIGSQHADPHLAGFGDDGLLVAQVLHPDQRHRDLLRHGPAMDEAGAADEMEAVGALGHPELHVPAGTGGDRGQAMEGLVVVAQGAAKQIALLGDQGAGRLLVQAVLVRRSRRAVLEQEAVIGRDQHLAAVQAVDDLQGQIRQLVDGLAHGLEGPGLGGGLVADGIHRVVIEVDHPMGLDEGPALVLLHGHEGVGLHRHAPHRGQHLAALLQRTTELAVDAQPAAGVVRQGAMRQQRRHAEPGVRRQHAEQGGQPGVDAVAAVELLGQLPGGLVAEGVADDDEDPPVTALGQQGRHLGVEESRLMADPVEPPARQQPVRQDLVPGQPQLGDEAGAIDLLDPLAQLLEDVPAAGLGLVGGLPEVPIALIDAVKPLGVGGKERRRVHPRQGAGQGMALVEQLSGLLQGPVDRVQRRARRGRAVG